MADPYVHALQSGVGHLLAFSIRKQSTSDSPDRSSLT